MGKVVLIAWIGVILFAGFWFGYHEEGANSGITLEGNGRLITRGQNAAQLDFSTIYIAKGKIAVKCDWKGRGAPGPGRMVIDISNKKILFVFDKTKEAASLEFDFVGADECKDSAPILVGDLYGRTRLPDGRTIAERRCRGFGTGDRQVKLDMWFASDLRLGRDLRGTINKMLRIKPKGELGTQLDAAEIKRPQASSFDYFPIPLVAKVSSSGASFALKIKSVKRGKIDSSVFQVPDGYKEVPPEQLDLLFGGLIRQFTQGQPG